MLWVEALMPLVGHFIFMTATAAAIFFYIDNQLFNISMRAPPVTQFDGSISHIASRPLQSDITTALSLALICTRSAAAMWIAATTWRCVFLLMEEEDDKFWPACKARDSARRYCCHHPPCRTSVAAFFSDINRIHHLGTGIETRARQPACCEHIPQLRWTAVELVQTVVR